MLNRRKMLLTGLRASTAFAVTRVVSLKAQVAASFCTVGWPRPENARVTKTQPLEDLSPVPSRLPAQTLSLGGHNSLKVHAAKKQLLAGAAISITTLRNDLALQELVKQQYSILVPEGELKWATVRADKGRYNFVKSDAFFEFAEQNKMLVRGHTLVWHKNLPSWVLALTDKQEVHDLLVDHIQTLMSRYRGRVHSWDVVNEAILPKDGQSNGLRKSFWFDMLGPEYIDTAFRAAREADPKAKLTYNDYSLENQGNQDTERRSLVLALLQRLKERKVPIDAVGLQSHLVAGPQNTYGSGLSEFLHSVRTLGLEVYITEADVSDDELMDDNNLLRDAGVAAAYRDYLSVALKDPAVRLVLTWGVSDRTTWLNGFPANRKHLGRPQRSLPFDDRYAPTQGYFAIRESFDRRFM